jgi:glycosyltransferase involved in cell wall biosynthesis
LPLALVEAMGGVPVVATDVPGHWDVVVPGKTGVRIPADNEAAVADAVIKLCAPARRAAVGEAARQWARTEFNIRKMLGRTAGVYRAVGRSVFKGP